MNAMSILKAVTAICCALGAVGSLAQTAPTSTGLTISVPNGYASVVIDDMRLASTAGQVRWTRVWTGKEWTFNPHWESLSQSWTNLTGASTGAASAGASLSASADASSGCWVMVDEDWQPSKGSVLIDERPPFPPMLSERTAPFNKLMGEADTNYPPPRIVSVDYASLCKGIAMQGSPVRDLEAVRIKNELYMGENGRYAYSNRAFLEKRAVRALPTASTSTVDAQLAAGKIALAPVALEKGYRWADKAGQWIEYNTQGQVVSYGDRNNNTVWLARDASGSLRGVVDANGRTLFTLHYTGKLITEVRDYPITGLARDLPARVVKYQYDAGNRLTGVTDVRGNQTSYDYDAANHLVSITDQEGRLTRLEYAGSSVKKRIAADGAVTDYQFDYDDVNKQFTSRITGPETAAGRRVDELTHNRSGKLVRHMVNGRAELEIQYDTGARAESHSNARGFTGRMTFNEFDQLVQLDRMDGTTVKQTFSAVNLNLLELVDSAGLKTQFDYDARGNLIKITQAAGSADQRVAERIVNELGQTVKLISRGRTERNGVVSVDAVTAFEYDAQGLTRAMTDPVNSEFRESNNRLGQQVSLTAPGNRSTYTEYDAAGHRVKMTNPLNHSFSYQFDKVGNQVASVDANANALRLQYDAADRVIARTVADAAKTDLGYDRQGMLTKVTDPDGVQLMSEYDNFQRLSKLVDGMGNTTTLSYQIEGGQSGVPGSLSGPTEIVYPTYTERRRYDQLERLTSTTLVADGMANRTSSIAYDARGLVRLTTDPYGKSESYGNDLLGYRSAFTDKREARTGFVFDVRGNLIAHTDARNNVHRFEYDAKNRLVRETLPMGQIASRSYDAAGNLAELIDFNGNKKVFGYDAGDRLSSVQSYDAGNILRRTVTYVWNKNNALMEWHDSAAGLTSSAVITRNGLDQKTSEVLTYPGGFSMRYDYAYTAAGKKSALTWPDGSTIGYGYSKHGALETITVPNEGTLSVGQFNWLVPVKTVLPGGTVQQASHDALLNLKTYEVKSPNQQALLEMGYSYGALSEPSQLRRLDANAGTSKNAALSYDSMTELTKVVSQGAGADDVETFGYDAVGNRNAHSRIAGSWTYNANNQLTEQGSGVGAAIYAYDAAGNVVRKTGPGGKVTVFAYNHENRLVAVLNGAQQIIARYVYDPMGRRIMKEQYRDRDGALLAQARRSYFLYADEGLLAEATQNITVQADQSVTDDAPPVIATEYGPRPDAEFSTGVLFLKTRNSNGEQVVAYYHHDRMQTPVLATDRAGKVVWAAEYDAFGRARIITPLATAESPVIVSALRLPGQIEDAETGLYYNFHRDYDPDAGRYLQRDPIGLRGGVNPYAYAGNSPQYYWDPQGLEFCVPPIWRDTISGGIGGAVGGFFGGGGLAGALAGGALGAVGGYVGSGAQNPALIGGAGIGAGVGGAITGGWKGIAGGAIAGAIGNIMASEAKDSPNSANMAGGIVGGMIGGGIGGLMEGGGFKFIKGVGLGVFGGALGGIAQDMAGLAMKTWLKCKDEVEPQPPPPPKKKPVEEQSTWYCKIPQ